MGEDKSRACPVMGTVQTQEQKEGMEGKHSERDTVHTQEAESEQLQVQGQP